MPSQKNNDLIVKGGLIALLIFLLRKAASSAPTPGDIYGGEGNVPGADGNNTVRSQQLSASGFKGRDLKKGTYYFTVPQKGYKNPVTIYFLGFDKYSQAKASALSNSITYYNQERVKNNRVPNIEANQGDVIGRIMQVYEEIDNYGYKYLIYEYEPFNSSKKLYLLRMWDHNRNQYEQLIYDTIKK